MARDENGKHELDSSLHDPVVADAYRARATELPPAGLDARIRAAAHAAVGDQEARGRTIRRWLVPLSIAATVVVSVTVVMQIAEHGTTERFEFAAARPTPSTKSGEPPAASQPGPVESEAPELARSATRGALEQKRADAVAPEALKKPNAGTTQLTATADRVRADIVAVRVSGSPGTYRFVVTIRSADSGCGQYADWWEVVGTDGRLLYRRVLLHSHADEQPFERSGGPVPIQPGTLVWVRAHMNPAGYTGVAFKGSVADGFAAATPPAGFAQTVATQPPLPDGCAF